MSRLINARWEAFAQARVKGMSATKAYSVAGYKPNRGNAATLKANQSIRARVAELQTEAGEKVMLDKAWVLEGLAENYRRAMQHEEIKDTRGISTGEYRYEGSVANRSLELIGKHLGMFNEKPQETPLPQPTYSGNVVSIDVATVRQKGRG